MAGCHHGLDGHESEWTPGDGDEQGGLVCCDSWGLKESDMTEQLNWTNWTLVNTFYMERLTAWLFQGSFSKFLSNDSRFCDLQFKITTSSVALPKTSITNSLSSELQECTGGSSFRQEHELLKPAYSLSLSCLTCTCLHNFLSFHFLIYE